MAIRQHFFSKIQKLRFPLFFQAKGLGLYFILSILPLAGVSFYGYREKQHLRQAQETLQRLKEKSLLWRVQAGIREQFIQSYSQVDPLFLEHIIEPLELQSQEIKTLNRVITHPAFEHCEELKQRLAFLLSSDNKIFFKEISKKEGPFFEESIEKQVHPVEACFDDLNHLLSLIENVAIMPYLPLQGAPQFLIKELSFKKKRTMEGSDRFLLNLEVIKRVPKQRKTS